MTDGLPGLALGLEAAEPSTMREPPDPPGESMFRRGLGRDVLWIGMLIGSLALGTGYVHWLSSAAGELRWRTMLFTILTLSQVGIALALRARRASIFARRGNPALPAAVALTLAMQLAALYWPPLSAVLGVGALGAVDMALFLAVSCVPLIAIEARKRWQG